MSQNASPNPYDYLLDTPVRPRGDPVASVPRGESGSWLPWLCAVAAIASWLYFIEPGRVVNLVALQHLIVFSDLSGVRVGKMLVCAFAGWCLGGIMHGLLQR